LENKTEVNTMGIQKRIKGHLRRKPHSRKQVRVRPHLRIKRVKYKKRRR